MDQRTRSRVRSRAGNRCEYCGLRAEHSPVAKLQIEHITPKKHGGSDELRNLALACIDCNLHKGSNLTGIDPQTNVITELYNPRTQKWSDHFAWEGVRIVGLTAVGRTTVRTLDVNAADRLEVRLATSK